MNFRDSTEAIDAIGRYHERPYTRLVMVRLNPLCLPIRALLYAGGLALWAAGPAGAGEPSPTTFLEFQSEPDGRCQILSEGGKLRILYNRHASRAIDYRLIRVFGDGHRQGRVVGTAPAGGEPVPLGCTRVDGRPQDWQLERANFTP